MVFPGVGSGQSRDDYASAIFAGGCFWCMEPPFDDTPSVIATTSGYTGGHVPEPSYEQVTTGRTGHFEAVEVRYDPAVVSYEELLDVFWRNIDPLDGGGQFCDRGGPYRSAIFYQTDSQRQAAEASRKALEASRALRGEVATQIVAATEVYPAEPYHQDYYQKNPIRYKFYRYSCGRDRRLETLWGEPEA